MLAGDIRVNVLSGNTCFARNQVTQTRSVQNRTRTEDLITRKTRDLQRRIGHDINRIRDEHEASLGGNIQQIREDLTHEVNGGTSKFQSGLTGLLLSTGSDDDQVCSTDNLNIIRALNGARRSELNAMRHIQGLGFHLRLVDIMQDDVTRISAHQAGVGNGSTNSSCANNRNL